MTRGGGESNVPLFPTADLIQREAELSSLRHALTAPCSVVLLEGEAGVGKTRFLSEALAQHGGNVLVGHSVRQRQPSPLLCIADALRLAGPMIDTSELSPVTGAVTPLLPELAPFLPEPPARPADPGSAQHQLFRGLIEVLSALTPLVLVLEDLHWADESTGELLQLLVRNKLPNLHLILTFRREDLDRGSPVRGLSSQVPAGVLQLRLELGTLDRTGVKLMIEKMLSTTVTDDFATFIYDRTEGLPFAVEETLRLLNARRDLVRLHGSWARHAVDTLEVPLAIQDAVAERILRLRPAGRDVISAIAVLGQDSTLRRVEELTGLMDKELEAGLDEASESALIREPSPGRFEFRHALAGEAAYVSIPPARRARLHKQAATLLLEDAEGSTANLVLHLREAQDPAWIVHALAAAEGPLAFLDPVGAYKLLRDVVISEHSRGDRIQVAARMCQLALRTPHADEAAQLASGLLTGPEGLDEHRAELLHALSLLLFILGDPATAYASLRRCVAASPTVTPTCVRATSILALPCEESMSLTEHLHWLERTEVGIDCLDDTRQKSAVAVNVLAARLVIGHLTPRQAIALIPDGRADPAVLREEQRARWNVAEFSLYLGSYATAQELIGVMTEEGGALGPEYRKDLAALSDHHQFLTGDWRGLAERAESFAAGTLEAGDAHTRVLLDYLFTVYASSVGRLPYSERNLPRLAPEARRVGMLPVALGVYAQHALDRLDLADVKHAHETALEGLALLRHKGVWAWAGDLLPIAAQILLQTEGPSAVAELVSEARTGLVGIHAPMASLGLEIASALLQETADDRARCLEIAATTAALLPRPMVEARTLEWAADACPTGERAMCSLTRAAEIYETLGAARDHARVTRRLRESGMPTAARRRANPGDALTARERQIVEQAVLGLTNREIAELLFLSPRTVEHHVERARRKLGLANRAALRGFRIANSATPNQPSRISRSD